MDPAKLTEVQLDALREITHIGCGAAATALSQLLGGKRVEMTVTESAIRSPEAISEKLESLGGILTGVHLTLRGGAEGQLMLVWSGAHATSLSRLLAGAEGTPRLMGESALMEVGNIVASAYLNALARVTELMLLPSVPTLVKGDPVTLADSLRGPDGDEGKSLVLETWLEVQDKEPTRGHVLIVPEPGSLDVLLGTLGL